MKQAESKRRILAMADLPMQPYDFDGVVQPEMSYARLSYDPASQRGSYLSSKGDRAVQARHRRRAGTRHNTRTETGCLLVGIDWDAGHPRTGD